MAVMITDSNTTCSLTDDQVLVYESATFLSSKSNHLYMTSMF